MIYNRKTGAVSEENAYGGKALHILYNTFFGGLMCLILSRRFISKIYGILQKKEKSNKKITELIEKYNINTNEFEKNISEYNSFNDFIIRKLKPDCRAVDMDKNILIAPADSCVTAIHIKNGTDFSVKGKTYIVGSLLHDKKAAEEFADGICLIFRLAVYDYHRFCFFDGGKVLTVKKIKGGLDSVNFYATGKFTLTANYREVTMLRTENFGDAAYIEVGAMLVGKIVNTYKSSIFSKGDEKGYFEFGGSTIVLLLKKGTVEIDSDILEYSSRGIETQVKYGEKIGAKIC